MNLDSYRTSVAEQQRTADLLRLTPSTGRQALDIGARDGHFSRLLAERYERVVALDLVMPEIAHPKVHCVRGNAAGLDYADGAFDLVFCAEVLEHIPPPILGRVCSELSRVSSERLLVGVPYKQDIRVGRTTCYSCGTKNPPWGHVNSFDEKRIAGLFPGFGVEALSFVGTTSVQTNAVSAALMDFAGNPYGTYVQEEPCVHCGQRLLPPPKRNPAQRVSTKLAFWSRHASGIFTKPRGNWMHVLLLRHAHARATASP